MNIYVDRDCGSHSIDITGEDPTSQPANDVRLDQSEGKDLIKGSTPPKSPTTSGTHTTLINSSSSSGLHSHICICSGCHSYCTALYNITGEDSTSQPESQVRPVQSEGQDLKEEITPQQSPPTSGTYISY